MSFEVKAYGEATIKTDTAKNSLDSFPMSPIGSHVTISGKTQSNIPNNSAGKHTRIRSNIFKAIVFSHLNHSNLNVLSNLAESVANSQSDGTNSGDEGEENCENQRRKSRFGPKS